MIIECSLNFRWILKKKPWCLLNIHISVAASTDASIHVLYGKKQEDQEFPNGTARFPVGWRQADIELILAAVIEKSQQRNKMGNKKVKDCKEMTGNKKLPCAKANPDHWNQRI